MEKYRNAYDSDTSKNFDAPMNLEKKHGEEQRVEAKGRKRPATVLRKNSHTQKSWGQQ
jgi:hypothetical protein